MRLATIRTAHGARAALIDSDGAFELPFADVGDLLQSHEDWRRIVPDRTVGPVTSVDFAPLVGRPGKIICSGLNFATHIAEMGQEPPGYPTLFAKFADSLIGARDPIVVPAVSVQLDYEAELAVVIGRAARHASRADAQRAIAGYTIMNDVSARDWQLRTSQWLQGKTFESTTPLGPVLVTPDELGSLADLELRCEVDGVVVQSALCGDLIFDAPAIVQYVSTILTLRPGDVLALGTPGGVALGSPNPRWLVPGSVVRTSIEGIGVCENRCVAEREAPTSSDESGAPDQHS